MYVDDVLSGSFSIEEGKEKVRQLSNLFDAGCFPLRKWIASHSSLLTCIPEEHRENSQSVNFHGEVLYRTLGLSWNSLHDTFCFNFQPQPDSATETKRSILSKLSQLFDPLGWLPPIIIRGKVFMQTLWHEKFHWDQNLPDNYIAEWTNYYQDLKHLSLIQVPRWIGFNDPDNSQVKLHGFSDTSMTAVSAVVYIKVIQPDGTSRITLLSSKTKVTPPTKLNSSGKPQGTRVTIPRLELTAATLVTKLVKNLQVSLQLTDVPTYLWTDSSITYHWICGVPSRWKQFVRNRVSVIQETLPDATWQHLPGEQNPADVASRGCSVTQLASHPLWWHRPDWLQLSKPSWPASTIILDNTTDLEEQPALVTTIQQIIQDNELIQRYSSFENLLRTAAWCKRFISNIKAQLQKTQRNISPYLTADELLFTQICLDQVTQQQFFNKELNILRSNKPLQRTSNLIQLTPFLDSNSMLRIGGRLQHSKLNPDEKHPIILPKDSNYTNLILRHLHHKTGHGTNQDLQTLLHQRYWIIGGRVPIRSTIRRCITCTRYHAKPMNQLMGQLPSSRVSPSRPFLHTGVDYAGPFTIKSWNGRNTKTFKGYLIVFICFSTSAVHLDMVTNYTTEGFISAFKRFISRRGPCPNLFSDCGTNFIGADNQLRKLFTENSTEFNQVASSLASWNTTWHFNPPSAPHFGGKWEAAVKSTKFHIKRIIGETLLTYEEWSTLLAEIEAILNLRPLCPLTSDPTDLHPLTPGHFLIGQPLVLLPEPNLLSVPDSRLNRLQLHRKFVNQFWKRWANEYLQRFLIRNKWLHTTDNLKIGSMVLIMNELQSPAYWPLGRVTQLHPGADQLIRVATIKTATSTFTRPITKLCLLPIDPPTPLPEPIP